MPKSSPPPNLELSSKSGNANNNGNVTRAQTVGVTDKDVGLTASGTRTDITSPDSAKLSDTSLSSPMSLRSFLKKTDPKPAKSPVAQGTGNPSHRKQVASAAGVEYTNSFTGDTHPYSKSSSSLGASLSHGNIVDTSSVTSVGPESARSDDDSTMIKSNSVPQVDAVSPTGIRADSSGPSTGGSLERKNSLRGTERLTIRKKPQPIFRNLQSNAVEREEAMVREQRDREKSTDSASNPPKTAPMKPERAFRDMMNSSIRNRSADRGALDAEEDHQRTAAAAGQQSNLFTNFVHQSTRAADGLGRASRGFLGKFSRSGSSHEREVYTPENHTFQIINLPLVEQTRKTRIKKHMDMARDKTEFWMPALPYRCIDFLNHHGVEVEGLYRVPGSGREIKQWQIRFDTEYDIDLLDESIELYDINVVGSMLKAWLRDLPDELLPRSTQIKIAAECAGADPAQTPQLMRDELSKLPPFNYYLLFAITCHISLLNSHSDKNKMTYPNLCICFQPCISIDAFCFQYLVNDWRNCWQGCWTERDYIQEEIAIAEGRLTPAPNPTVRRGREGSLPTEKSSTSGKLDPPRQPSASPARRNTPPARPNSAEPLHDNIKPVPRKADEKPFTHTPSNLSTESAVPKDDTKDVPKKETSKVDATSGTAASNAEPANGTKETPLKQSSDSKDAKRASTPPALAPMQPVSPMRM